MKSYKEKSTGKWGALKGKLAFQNTYETQLFSFVLIMLGISQDFGGLTEVSVLSKTNFQLWRPPCYTAQESPAPTVTESQYWEQLLTLHIQQQVSEAAIFQLLQRTRDLISDLLIFSTEKFWKMSFWKVISLDHPRVIKHVLKCQHFLNTVEQS